MMQPAGGDGALWLSFPLFTVGEVVNGYQAPGILDGISAWRISADRLRFFVNHEMGAAVGYPYGINNGSLLLTGARISYFAVDRQSLQIVHADGAYKGVFDRAGERVRRATQINEGTSPTEGFDRFCSAAFFEAGTYGLVDDLYITGEETADGQAYALNPRSQRLHAVPMLGRAAFESVAFVDTGNPATVGVVIGDDRAGAPLYLYVGTKDAVGDGSILDRNGLAQGVLHVWVATDGSASPQDVNGTGATRAGTFVAIPHVDAAQAGQPGYDALGYASMATLDALSAAVGAGQFSAPDFGLRSPDNLTWARDGRIYVQEDRSTNPGSLFGATSGTEASLWAIEPATGALSRVGEIDRSAVPAGQTDSAPADFGNWESSGVIDVSGLFGLPAPITLLMLDVEAHSVRDGVIAANGLAEGGQLLFMLGVQAGTPTAAALEAADPQSLVEALAVVGTTVAGEAAPDAEAALAIAGPNPFQTTTAVRFATATTAPVRVALYDALGREVVVLADRTMAAGPQVVALDGRELPAGVYVVRLTTAEGVHTLRVTLAR